MSTDEDKYLENSKDEYKIKKAQLELIFLKENVKNDDNEETNGLDLKQKMDWTDILKIVDKKCKSQQYDHDIAMQVY